MTDRREQASRGAVALGEPGGELGAYQDLANDHQGDTAAPHQMPTAMHEGLEGGFSDKAQRRVWTQAQCLHQTGSNLGKASLATRDAR